MATQTLSNADAILKDLYVGPIVEQLNQKTYMLDQVERDADSVDHTGRRAVIPVHSNRNRGRGSRGDNSTLPTAGRQSWQDAIVPIRYHYYGIELTDPAIEAATGANEGAFVNLLQAETKGVATDMRKDINRQVFGTGGATGGGALATLASASSGTTVNVDQGVQYIKVGDPVDVLLTATGVVTNGVANTTVTARAANSATPSITIADAQAGATGTTYSVYLAGTYGTEMDGLRHITNDARTLHSINSSTAGNEFWNGQEIDAANAVAGETLFERLADLVGATGNGETDSFLTTRGIRRRLADTYQSQKRYNDARAVNVHGGFTAIMVNEIPVVADDDCPVNHAFAINKGAFRWFEQTKPGWLTQRDGSVFSLKDGSTAGTKVNAWQAWFRWYAALGCVQPQLTGRLLNCDDAYAA